MITNRDQDIIHKMVGTKDKTGPLPDEFVAEYTVRLGMLARAGITDGIGPVGMMQILREFKISPANQPDRVTDVDWRNVPPDTPVYCRNQRGLFKGVSGETDLLLFKPDGQRIQIEVNKKEMSIAKAIVEGLDDSAFEKDPDDVSVKTDDGPSEEDILFAAWEGIDAGTPVQVTLDGETVDGEFVDVDGTKLAVSVNDTLHVVEPENVTMPTEA